MPPVNIDSFRYHTLDDGQQIRVAAVRSAIIAAASIIDEQVEDCADKTIAMQHLVDALARANRAIANKGAALFGGR